MNTLSIDEYRPLNRWDNSFIQPGKVGSVGDVVLGVKLRHSAPDTPIRFDNFFSHSNMIGITKTLLLMLLANGANISDGQGEGYMSGGGVARVVNSNWGGRRHFKVRHGWIMQDLRAPDKVHDPTLGEIPHYDWNNKVATTYQAMRTGNRFLPLPGPYQPAPGEQTRGARGPTTQQIGENSIVY